PPVATRNQRSRLVRRAWELAWIGILCRWEWHLLDSSLHPFSYFVPTRAEHLVVVGWTFAVCSIVPLLGFVVTGCAPPHADRPLIWVLSFVLGPIVSFTGALVCAAAMPPHGGAIASTFREYFGGEVGLLQLPYLVGIPLLLALAFLAFRWLSEIEVSR